LIKTKRLFDTVIALGALIALVPLFVFGAIGVKLTSPGPIFYRAQRIARDRRRPGFNCRSKLNPERRRKGSNWGREFTMYKFRSMRVAHSDVASPITARNDPRVFPFGKFLRATKIDELPQLFNVLKGDMSLVGPRPEAPEIVRRYYKQDDLETLQVAPGITSPGTVYYYTHRESTLAKDDVLDQYVGELLSAKLALDRVYLRRAGLLYDVRIILRTVAGITARTLGLLRWFPDPPELMEARIDWAKGGASRRLSYSEPVHHTQNYR